ncbi:CU044_5270 family protein [Streptomyces johnsoniae]|uniref:CU044_5270 family protein n=1 Tax=Streptomyces johnsoniae TaxID=3075532 RepID=A0ABU2RZ59_9ACTN|nr:CU044_5270 family protein [Streptomyces sp. DSM 41886]MDT0442000.1 CU044_5270 family protein [Streptomyces sp. DSM 41886]
MIRTHRHRGEDPSRAELARLLPAPGDPELPADRRLLLEEHLMRETEQPAASPGRRRLVLAAVPVATAAVIVAAVTFTGGEGEGTDAASGGSTLQRLAAAAAQQPETEVAPDQVAYTEQYYARYKGGEPNNGDNVEREESGPYEAETWVTPDGNDGWYVDSAQFPHGARLIDGRPDWNQSLDAAEQDTGVSCLVERPDVVESDPYMTEATVTEEDCLDPADLDDPANLHQPSYDYFQELTTDPEELVEKIYRENGSADSGDQADQWAFHTVGRFFEHAPLPPEVAEAALLAFEEIPGVTVGVGTDAAGREGVAVTRHGTHLGEETTFLFDEETGGYLGARIEQVDAGHFHPVGTVFEDSALTDWSVADRGVVDELSEARPEQ